MCVYSFLFFRALPSPCLLLFLPSHSACCSLLLPHTAFSYITTLPFPTSPHHSIARENRARKCTLKRRSGHSLAVASHSFSLFHLLFSGFFRHQSAFGRDLGRYDCFFPPLADWKFVKRRPPHTAPLSFSFLGRCFIHFIFINLPPPPTIISFDADNRSSAILPCSLNRKFSPPSF
jgi:hypothetical protein